jgi:hypothetical protein
VHELQGLGGVVLGDRGEGSTVVLAGEAASQIYSMWLTAGRPLTIPLLDNFFRLSKL